ncbi:hypothetical protein F4780DRAFT_290716 [Xylariomycetidae sp. FL0641]|nr:hypothetical protein F4780DRAFT_290716 [Xylariomycetidae sp. FL0641]
MAPVEILCIPPPISFSSCKSRRTSGNCSGRMAMVSNSHQAAPKCSLDYLSSELLALIFEKLREVDSRSLSSIRLLSRRMGAIVLPIQYETIRLHERILSPQAEALAPQWLAHVSTHTRHVEARSDLNPEHVRRLLDRVQRLLSLTWRYTGLSDFHSSGVWMPSDILNRRHLEVSRTKLYVEDLPLRDFTGQAYQDTYVKAIPTSCLVSLKMARPTPPLTSRLESLKLLLLRSRGLETFHYNDRGQGTRFDFRGNEKLPAFKELRLRSYDWDHSAATVRQHWDFSRIRHLELVDVPLLPFLNSVPLAHLRYLETLHSEDFSAHLADRRQEATEALHALICQIKGPLRALNLTCDTRYFSLTSALIPHSRNLRTLGFRDLVGFGDETRRCPTLNPRELVSLASSMFELRNLELDMDMERCNPPVFLRAVCAFPKLDTLILHTQTTIDTLESDNDEDVKMDDEDSDYEMAIRIFETLVKGKQNTAGWKSITINVGGWRRVLVRRMSAAWRERNERGIYAERCFVLERREGEQGGRGMMIREEMPMEA